MVELRLCLFCGDGEGEFLAGAVDAGVEAGEVLIHAVSAGGEHAGGHDWCVEEGEQGAYRVLEDQHVAHAAGGGSDDGGAVAKAALVEEIEEELEKPGAAGGIDRGAGDEPIAAAKECLGFFDLGAAKTRFGEGAGEIDGEVAKFDDF